MQTNNKTWQYHLVEAKSHFKNANHLAYVTLTLLKENRLLVKILSDLHQAAVNIIKAFLLYEYQNKQVTLTRDPLKNLDIFISKIAPKYIKQPETDSIVLILRISRQHKDSSLEFVRRDKFVIFNNGKYEVLTIDMIKSMISNLSRIISAFPVK